MSRARAKKGNKERFLGIPLNVLESEAYRSLRASSVKMLVDLAKQYNGYNNGDFTAAYSVLRRHGWNSKGTIQSALKELMDKGFIVRTRDARFQNPNATCALYGVTWRAIDECKDKLDIKPTKTPSNDFRNFIKNPTRPQLGPSSTLKSGRDRLRDGKGRYIPS
jgi:hypothetical protein